MRSMILATLLTVASTATAATTKTDKSAPQLKQWELPNGLKVIFVPDHKAPVVTVQVFYHAGAKDEPAGKRGMAHMFEHMMFKGSTHVPPEEHARFIQLVGGENNAFTQDDTTGYHDTVPPSALEFTHEARGRAHAQPQADAEDDRLRAPGGRGRAARAHREQPDRQGAARGAARWPTRSTRIKVSAAGDKKDLDTVTPADCQKFYDEYYRPNNAALVVVGDTDEATVKTLVEKYFGPLEKGPPPRHDAPQGARADRDARTRRSRCRCSCRSSSAAITSRPATATTCSRSRCCSRSSPAASRRGCISGWCARTRPRSARAASCSRTKIRGCSSRFALYLPTMDVEKLKAGARRGDRQAVDDEGRAARAAEGEEPAGGARGLSARARHRAGHATSASIGSWRTIRRGRSPARRSTTRSPPTTSCAWPRSIW